MQDYMTKVVLSQEFLFNISAFLVFDSCWNQCFEITTIYESVKVHGSHSRYLRLNNGTICPTVYHFLSNNNTFHLYNYNQFHVMGINLKYRIVWKPQNSQMTNISSMLILPMKFQCMTFHSMITQVSVLPFWFWQLIYIYFGELIPDMMSNVFVHANVWQYVTWKIAKLIKLHISIPI